MCENICSLLPYPNISLEFSIIQSKQFQGQYHKKWVFTQGYEGKHWYLNRKGIVLKHKKSKTIISNDIFSIDFWSDSDLDMRVMRNANSSREPLMNLYPERYTRILYILSSLNDIYIGDEQVQNRYFFWAL